MKKVVPKMENIQQEQYFWENVPNALEYSTPVDLKLDLPARREVR